MCDKGDAHDDPLFNRVFELFLLLDNAKTYEDIRTIMKEKCTFSPIEINRINSPCLDGIIATIKEHRPLDEIVRSYWKYMDTCKFYMRLFIYPPMFLACVSNRLEIMKLFIEIEGPSVFQKDISNKYDTSSKFLYHACIYDLTDMIKLLIKYDAHLADEDFMFLCNWYDIDMIELVYKPYITITAQCVYNACAAKRINVVKFLLEKGGIVSPQVLQHAENNTTPEIWQLLLASIPQQP